jgi:hypothetical protein
MNKRSDPSTGATDLSSCPGTTIAFNRRSQFAREEHSRVLTDHAGKATAQLARSWGNCWNCGLPLGCSICTTSTEAEILCTRCALWGTKAAFLQHGPLERGKPLEAYPVEWRREYEAPAMKQIELRLNAIVQSTAAAIAAPTARDPRIESEKEWER